MDATTPAPPKDRSHWTVRKCVSYEEMEMWHLHDWQQVSPSLRLQTAWDMVVEAWSMKKRDLNELRFQRVITSVKRA